MKTHPRWTEQPPESYTISGPEDTKSLVGRFIVRARARNRDFVKMETPHERDFMRTYRGWVRAERDAVLAELDATYGKAKPFTVTFDPGAAGKRLSSKVKPKYRKAATAAFNFTAEEIGGIPVFSMESDEFYSAIAKRESLLTGSAPDTIRKRLLRVLADANASGAPLTDVRKAVASVFDISASGGRALQIARTEVAGLMNMVRDAMFEEQGFTDELWVHSGDEVVRESHVLFGEEDARPRGFNYLDLLDDAENEGILSFPGDPRCLRLEETMSCRCVKVPVK